MQLEEGLDTGPVFARVTVPIGAVDHRRRAAPGAGRGRHAPAGRRTAGRARRPAAARRRADVRRQDQCAGAAASIGRDRRSRSIGWCASAVRGRRSAAGASRSSPPSWSMALPRARRADRRSRRRPPAGDGSAGRQGADAVRCLRPWRATRSGRAIGVGRARVSSAVDDQRSPGGLSLPAADRPRRRLRQPAAAERARSIEAQRARSRLRHRAGRTARRACVERAMP